jgi:hypothetical protein
MCAALIEVTAFAVPDSLAPSCLLAVRKARAAGSAAASDAVGVDDIATRCVRHAGVTYYCVIGTVFYVALLGVL